GRASCRRCPPRGRGSRDTSRVSRRCAHRVREGPRPVRRRSTRPCPCAGGIGMRHGNGGDRNDIAIHLRTRALYDRRHRQARRTEVHAMAESVYKIIELVGTSTDSWEAAARTAVERASQSLRDLRVAEIVELDMQITDGKVEAYRAKA